MRIGFIGTGNMGAALIKGYLSASPGASVCAYDKDSNKLEALAAETGLRAMSDPAAAAADSDLLILAVKPNTIPDAIRSLASAVRWNETVLVSIAAGVTIGALEATCTAQGALQPKIVRAMPNTPALVGQGMAALSRNRAVSDEEMEAVQALFTAVGQAEEVDESLMDAVVGVSGSSPAYAYLFIEALADGAVAQGMPRKQAYTFAAQAVLGAAAMVLSTGQHPGELKDMVCSPGGTTIEAVQALEKSGFRSAVQAAVTAAADKSRAMARTEKP